MLGLGLFCLVLILLAIVEKYLLNSFAIFSQSLIGNPFIFKVLILSVLQVLLNSEFIIFQIVLFLLEAFLILSA
jgi:hypothetical protein